MTSIYPGVEKENGQKRQSEKAKKVLLQVPRPEKRHYPQNRKIKGRFRADRGGGADVPARTGGNVQD